MSATTSPPVTRWKQLFFPLLYWLLLLGLLFLAPMAFIGYSFDKSEHNDPFIAARAQAGTVSTAIKMYQAKNGVLPLTLDSLAQPPEDAIVRTPVMEPNGILDPWGRKFIYKTSGKDGKPYDIYSAGPDGKDGTDDDVHTK